MLIPMTGESEPFLSFNTFQNSTLHCCIYDRSLMLDMFSVQITEFTTHTSVAALHAN